MGRSSAGVERVHGSPGRLAGVFGLSAQLPLVLLPFTDPDIFDSSLDVHSCWISMVQRWHLFTRTGRLHGHAAAEHVGDLIAADSKAQSASLLTLQTHSMLYCHT